MDGMDRRDGMHRLNRMDRLQIVRSWATRAELCGCAPYERLRGAPNYMTTFFTIHYYATLDSRLQMVKTIAPRNGHYMFELMLHYNECLPHEFHPAPYIELEHEQRALLSAGHYFCHYSRTDEQHWFSSLLSIHVLHFS